MECKKQWVAMIAVVLCALMASGGGVATGSGARLDVPAVTR
jgi:hypothetical protein